MPLSVIGAGFGRTGTTSIKLALEHLGFGPCHHMSHVFQDQRQLPYWQALASGDRIGWETVFSGYRSSIDWPSTHYWRELAAEYPDAKILLSTRPSDSWWRSFSATIRQLIENRHDVPDAYRRSVLAFAHQIIERETFGGDLSDKDAVLAAYRHRIDEVILEIPKERLLVFDVTEGWQPLCEFLSIPVPAKEFPRSNSTDEFWQTFGDGLSRKAG